MDRQETQSRSALWGELTGVFAVVFLGYAGGALLAWSAFGSEEGPAFFYPSAGVTVAAMLLSRRAVWPAVIAAVVLGEMFVDMAFGSMAWVSAAFAAANVAEPLVGASLVLAWCRGTPDLRLRKHLVAFIAGACVIAPIVGGLIGGTASSQAGDGDPWPVAVLKWWAGDSLGVLVAASAILLWPLQKQLLRARPVEAAGLLVITAAVTLVGFWTLVPPSMVLLPFVAWAAIRLDMLGAALAGVIIAVMANVATSRGRGAFLSLGFDVRVALSQVLIAMVVLTGLLIAHETGARTKAVREREAERRERVRLESLASFASGLAAALTPHEIGAALADWVLGSTGAASVAVGVIEPDPTRMRWVAMEGYPPEVLERFGGVIAVSDSPVSVEMLTSGRPVIFQDSAAYEARYGEKRWLTSTGNESVAGWPLKDDGVPFGVLIMLWREPQPVDDARQSFLTTVATMVSQALVRSRVYADERSRAEIMHSAVLPTGPIEAAGLDAAVAYEPADLEQGLGGDWYDLMPLPDGRTYFAVGDVVGHGLPAVEDMAQLRNAGRALAQQGLPAAQLLAELNGFTRHASLGKFATMSVVIVDPAHGRLSYGSAGHPPLFLRYAADGEVVRLTDAYGPVLGPVQEATYVEASVGIGPGDILVMYTDGLVERHGMDIETGLARAQQIIAGWDGGDSMSRYCKALQETLSPPPRSDDVCVVAVRFH